MKKVCAATDLGKLLVKKPSDAANLLSHFLLSGVPEERLRAHTWASWSVAAFHKAVVTLPVISACVWKHLGGACWISTEIHLARMSRNTKGKIKKAPLVVRDREHPFAEDLITDEAGVVEPQLPVLTNVFCLVDALRMGRSYELIEKLWAQVVLNAGLVNLQVAWTLDEVLVGSVKFRSHFVSFPIYFDVLLSVNLLNRNATPSSATRGWSG